jgi:hypothetical protein
MPIDLAAIDPDPLEQARNSSRSWTVSTRPRRRRRSGSRLGHHSVSGPDLRRQRPRRFAGRSAAPGRRRRPARPVGGRRVRHPGTHTCWFVHDVRLRDGGRIAVLPQFIKEPTNQNGCPVTRYQTRRRNANPLGRAPSGPNDTNLNSSTSTGTRRFLPPASGRRCYSVPAYVREFLFSGNILSPFKGHQFTINSRQERPMRLQRCAAPPSALLRAGPVPAMPATPRPLAANDAWDHRPGGPFSHA